VSRDQGIKLGATPSDTETAPQRTPRRDLAASPCSGGNIQRVAHRPQHVARAHAALQDADAVHLAVQRVPVQRISGDTAQAAHDQVITEAPVAIVVNGISHAVMMATPCDLDDFARGFALSEGLIARPEELLDIDSVASPSGIELHLRVSARAEAALTATRRAMAGRTGCGLCGIESLQALQARHPVKAAATPSATTHGTPAAAIQPASDVSETSWDPIAPQALAAAFRQLASWQALHADTGGCHAAAWADAEGHIQAVRLTRTRTARLCADVEPRQLRAGQQMRARRAGHAGHRVGAHLAGHRAGRANRRAALWLLPRRHGRALHTSAGTLTTPSRSW
jgi:formate dehydrogenase assembly factor FdhD